MVAYSELIKTLLLDPIAFDNGESWVFKIEIFKNQQGYFASLWRLDSYDVAPTFPTTQGHIASESFFIDESFRFDGLGLYSDDVRYFKSVDACQTYVLECIYNDFEFI